MPPRSRYAVDPSLTAPSPQHQQQQQHQQEQWQQPGQTPFQPAYGQQPPNPADPNANPQLHNVSDRRSPLPTGVYAPSSSNPQPQTYHAVSAQAHDSQHPLHPSFVPPQNHIPPPPHSAGPAVHGPRVRIDPSQMPNPIEAQEMDQNLYDDEDFLSCQTKGVIPLAGTDWRGVDQGGSRS